MGCDPDLGLSVLLRDHVFSSRVVVVVVLRTKVVVVFGKNSPSDDVVALGRGEAPPVPPVLRLSVENEDTAMIVETSTVVEALLHEVGIGQPVPVPPSEAPLDSPNDVTTSVDAQMDDELKDQLVGMGEAPSVPPDVSLPDDPEE